MAYQVQWTNADQLLHTELTGNIDLPELKEFFDEIFNHLNESPTPVDMILDVRDMARQAMIPLDQLQNMAGLFHHEQLGWTAIIGMHPSLAFTIKLLVKQFDFQYAAFDELDEATQFLKQVRILQTVNR